MNPTVNAIETQGVADVTYDSWCASTKYIEHIHSKNKVFFSELKSDRNIFMHHPAKKTHCMVKSDGIATLIKKHYWHKIKYVKYKTKDASEVLHKTYSFVAKLKDCFVPIKFVVIFGKWNRDDKRFHILITSQLKASAKTVIKNYLLRWGIEICFKELKDIGTYALLHGLLLTG